MQGFNSVYRVKSLDVLECYGKSIKLVQMTLQSSSGRVLIGEKESKELVMHAA